MLANWFPLDWIAAPPAQEQTTSPQAKTDEISGFDRQWALPPCGLSGHHPLPWWAAGDYAGPLRREVLQLHRMAGSPHRQGRLDRLLAACLPGLAAALEAELTTAGRTPLLVPIPSWKRRANPLPGQLARQLSLRLGWGTDPHLLRRSRPVLGQHHLGRQQRWANQAEAFACLEPPSDRRGPRQRLLLVDDILTTGATLWGAAEAMRRQGWRIAGACCLARTLPRGRRAVI